MADGTCIPTSRCAPLSSAVLSEPGGRIAPSSIGLVAEQDFGENNFDVGDAEVSLSESRGGENFVADYHPFSQPLSIGEFDCSDEFFSNGISIKYESETKLVELDDTENERNEDSCGEEDSSNDGDSDKSTIRSAMAYSVMLHRVGIAGTAKKSLACTGRWSRVKAHVDKSRRGGTLRGVGAVPSILSAVRIAAVAATSVSDQEKSLENEYGQTVESSAHDSNNLTSGNSLAAKILSPKWKSVVQSTVADILMSQDASIHQQTVDVASFKDIQNTSPPPGTTSMGILGEVVQEQLPDIPPRPGAFLVGVAGNSSKSRVTVRSSIPHSSDDTHIANLRLSVFSQFNEEQQRNFRNRSIEVLNTRRRKGAVVLVAEEPLRGKKRDHLYFNEMHSRIEKGHEYGGKINCQFTGHSLLDTPSPSLIVRPGRGVTVTSVSSGVAVDAFVPKLDGGSIVGSVECSHQEFRGTMLGNSRPKGSLMYVTEVAVRTDARRSGAGAMLMRGVDEVAVLRNVETIYLHVDVTNRAACAMYEKCGYHYLDKRVPIYAQFTASLNLHDGATRGRTHYLMCKNLTERTTWLEEDESRWDCFADN
ncbi:hypothetical protein ACHAW5_001019 [Stephanodiscus triporus]|uniref:N-acetyltransferase domain-containing protein n=1 Tax=Stephanodiscus triporus TaxID=2934178 RepID=A0ABD3PL03_9STRA